MATPAERERIPRETVQPQPESPELRSAIKCGRTQQARMAKSADAADLKSAGRKAVGVQVPLRAPENLEDIECLRIHKFLLCRICVGIAAA